MQYELGTLSSMRALQRSVRPHTCIAIVSHEYLHCTEVHPAEEKAALPWIAASRTVRVEEALVLEFGGIHEAHLPHPIVLGRCEYLGDNVILHARVGPQVDLRLRVLLRFRV